MHRIRAPCRCLRKTNLARLRARRPRRNRNGICSSPEETVSPDDLVVAYCFASLGKTKDRF